MVAAALVNLHKRQRVLDVAVASARAQLPGALDAASECCARRQPAASVALLPGSCALQMEAADLQLPAPAHSCSC